LSLVFAVIAVHSGIADVGQGTPVTPARPEIEEVEKDEEQHRQPGRDQRNYSGDRVNDRPDQELPSDLPCLFRGEMGVEQPMPVSRVPPHSGDEDTNDGQDPTVERSGNWLVRCPVKCFGEYGGWERQKCDQHQMEDVQQQQRSIHADDVLEHSVVVDPDCADHQKAHDVGEIGWLELEKFCSKCRIGWRHFDFEHQQGDGDREYAVAKCLQAGGIHAYLLCEQWLLFPSLRVCIVIPSWFHLGYSDLRDAISIQKRYFTSDLSSRS
jgi:hypothetical protein